MIRRTARLSAAFVLALLLGPACRAQEARPELPTTTSAAPDLDEALRAAAFAPEVLQRRRAELLASLPPGSVVVLATPRPLDDDTWPYRPMPDFLYLTGVRAPGFALLLAEGIDLLLAPARDPRHELWNGPRLAPGAEGTGFAAVIDRRGLNERVAQLLPGAKRLYLGGIDAERLELPAKRPPIHPADQPIAALRQVKDRHEVALLQRAIDITGAGLLEAYGSARPGMMEHELQAVIEYLFLRHGAQRPGFASIVGSGPNSCVLHYTANRRRMAAGDLVVMDVGAELWGYTADVTRTIPVSGTFTPRQREVYELVLRAQAAGIAAVRPGATIRQVDEAARRVIREAGLAGEFPHGTSHWLGMDVHDVGAYSRPLEPGMVLTVEPGVYIAAEGLGVRIEDDVLVTADGCRVLSAGIPRAVEEIEALCAKRAGVGARPAAPLPLRDPEPEIPRPGAPSPEQPRRRFFK